MPLTNLPALSVQAGFGYGMLASPVWTDLSPWAREFDIQRGRQYELADFEAGTADITFMFSDGRFDPLYTLGPHYGDLLPRVPLRIRATWAGVTYGLFYGFVERWPPQRYQGRYSSIVKITASELFAGINNYKFPQQEDGVGGGARNLGTYRWSTGNFNPGNSFSGVGIHEANRVYVTVHYKEKPNAQTPASFDKVKLKIKYTNGDGRTGRIGHITLDGRLPEQHPHHTGHQPHHHGRNHRRHNVHHVKSAWQTDRYNHALEVKLQGDDTVVSIQDVTVVGHGSGTGFDGKDCKVVFTGERALIGREKSDAQLRQALDYFGVPSSWVNIKHAGRFTQIPQSPWGQTLRDTIRQIQDTEMGQIYVDRSGIVQFEDRDWRYNNWDAAAKVWHDGSGTSPYVYKEMVPSYDDQYIANIWEVTRVTRGGNDNPRKQVATSGTSVSQYGPISEQRTPALRLDSDCRHMAKYLLARTKDPQYRVASMTVEPMRDPANLFPECLAMDISKSIIVDQYPPKDQFGSTYHTSTEQMVDHVSHKGSPQEWVTEVECTPRVTVPW